MKDEEKKALVAQLRRFSKRAKIQRLGISQLLATDVKCHKCRKLIDLNSVLPASMPEPLRSGIVAMLRGIFTFGGGTILCDECSD